MSAPENATYAYIGALVDELARSGVAHLCLCPGSRSTPLAISAARHPGMRVWALIDERSAGFFALGMAKALRTPVAVLSTSGTAAANFFPAVIEARYGRVPLIVLTADRPRESRDCGTAQTIDQVRLYGEHVKWFVDLAAPEATDAMLRYARTTACQAVTAALQGPAGPVHLNVPLREPLVPVAVPGELLPEERRTASGRAGRAGGRPYAAAARSLLAPEEDMLRNLARDLAETSRGVIVCGPHDDPALAPSVCALAAVLGYPVLADPLSQVRCGPHNRSQIIDGYDAMLRVDALDATLAPDLILRIGGTPASKPLLQYLQRHDRAHQVIVDEGGGWNDPTRVAAEFVHVDPRRLCDALLPALGPGVRDASASAWLATWQRLNRQARQAMARRLGRIDEPFEGKVFAELAALLPDGSTLYVGNSMPVRDLDTFFPSTSRAIRFLGNRGASGIDGLVSAALGAAAAETGPVVLVLGDLAFYHDMNGLLAARRHGLQATIVLLHNDGGGIFSFLPQADDPEHFEELFGAPHGLNFRLAAEMYGLAYRSVECWEEFRAAVQQSLGS
ncbi:MAG: 2-succinyl-5-enolpyruvyl-6-hydroxy-3-cyclohexene-1-carboxylic-acid synthase, partial [Armatimonadetes bacterium]|nr:2-succinyl-5-enolpyruvyl-6-hydroxy-3-cyclohexene-1-carboxylic-acid synthase [Armatimonadota bacterium]